MHSDMSEDMVPPARSSSRACSGLSRACTQEAQASSGNAFFRQERGVLHKMSDALGTETYWPWGPSVGDLNADGFDDVFIAASMNFPFRYGVNSVLLNNRGRTFLDSSSVSGIKPHRLRRTAKPWFTLDCPGADRGNSCLRAAGAARQDQRLGVTRVAVLGDLRPRRRRRPGHRHQRVPRWPDGAGQRPGQERTPFRCVAVKLVATHRDRDGLGAFHRSAAGRSSSKVARRAVGLPVAPSLIHYFGLGATQSVDGITVLWPSGKQQVVARSDCHQYHGGGSRGMTRCTGCTRLHGVH